MKKTLLSLFMFVAAIATSWAGDVVFDFTNPEGLTPSVTPAEVAEDAKQGKGVAISDKVFTNGGVSISFTDPANAQSSNKTQIFTNMASKGYAKDLRVYRSGGSLTISSEENITSVVFTGAKITTISVDGTALANGTWTGSAKSVTFAATATLNINTITVTTGDGAGGGEVVTPDPETAKTLWSEAFDASQGAFTIEDKTLPEGLTYVWKWDSYKNMKASAFANNTAYVAESWLVSPVLDLTSATETSLSFDHAGKYFGTMAEEALLMVRAENGEWEQLPINEWFTGNDWTFVTATADIAKYAGKKMQFAFVYKSTAEKAGTWEVKNVKITGKGSIATDAPEVQVPVYTSIDKMKADATDAAAAIVYEFRDLLVTGVAASGKNISVYVTDGKAGMQFYGANKPAFKAGDRITGKVSGSLVLYKGLTEVTGADYTEVTVASENNEVAPTLLTIAQIGTDNGVKTYENMLVKLEGISFDADALANKNINMVDDSDNSLVLRDNFGVLGDFIFDQTKTYNVTAIVSSYNGTPQLYPLSADDVEMITNLSDPETAWTSEEVVILSGEEWKVSNRVRTKSTADITYSSSNEEVATVAAGGVITVKGYGYAVITAETKENSEYLASKASFKLYVIEGKGTLEAPYTAADAQYYNGKIEEKVWVKGDIIGCYDNNALVDAITKAVETNIAIGTRDLNLPVQLPKGQVRDDLNLVAHGTNYGKTVWVYGNITSYFQVPGVKNVTDYSWDGKETLTAISAPVVSGEAAVIYSIDGRRLAAPVKGFNIINGKKVLVK